MEFQLLARDFLHQMYLLRRVRPQRQISEAMRGEAFILQYIDEQGGNVQPSEISEAMDTSTARVAAALKHLENNGFITRMPDREDRRRVFVGLTPAGVLRAEQHRQIILENAAKMLRLLGEQDAAEYVRITGRLAHIALSRSNEKSCEKEA
ncbi:MAG: hypothetical protein DBX52_00150 [Clostridiales bacterium]|nr:MAG: hypothetical protein DBX52_00150 [Clostridiales bacterium]